MNESGENGKITWGALLAAAKAAGIKPGDAIDNIDIAWGDANALQCVKDNDFGWQISLAYSRKDMRYCEDD